jgi:hypothetical protein
MVFSFCSSLMLFHQRSGFMQLAAVVAAVRPVRSVGFRFDRIGIPGGAEKFRERDIRPNVQR